MGFLSKSSLCALEFRAERLRAAALSLEMQLQEAQRQVAALVVEKDRCEKELFEVTEDISRNLALVEG